MAFERALFPSSCQASRSLPHSSGGGSTRLNSRILTSLLPQAGIVARNRSPSRTPHCDPVEITRYRGIREDRARLGLDLGLLVAAGEVSQVQRAEFRVARAGQRQQL